MMPPHLNNLPERRRWWPHRVSVASIILVFVAINVVAITDAMRLAARNREIIDNMFSSIERVSRLGRDLDHERILVGEHIFERHSPAMADLDRRITELEDNYDATARAYEPIATLPREGKTWEAVKAEVLDVRASIHEALALSRKNEDAEAQQLFAGLDVRFDTLEQHMDALRMINRLGAEQSVEATRAAGRLWLIILGIGTLVGIALTVAAGWVSDRLLIRREEELRRIAGLLEEHNRDLDAFAGRVAHDLRGPLTSISLVGSKLARHAPTDEGTSALLQRGVKRMEALIGDLLALARVDAVPRDAECDPAMVAASVREDFAAQVIDAGVAMQVTVEAAKVRCGEGLLRQVLWNLADNAVKFRRSGVPTELEIRGHASERAHDLSVRDNGVGMSRDDARQAFEPFFRAQRSKETTGTGLGLAIVKRIVEACGGTVSIESEVDHGTTLLIHLPLAVSPAG